MASKLPRISNINHAAGIYADMSVDGPAIGTLVAVIDRAKNLPNRKTMGKQNPYCAARLGKEAKKTETDLRGGQTPKWDHELRFTVHESPDYFRLKVSIFNDDKKTDLIGETWIDLKDLIIPGGSQSDQWHPLQYRGKYAGEVRIEMTYYDTRPEDEAVIERRMQAAEKVHAKSGSARSPAPVGSSSLSGPRQLEKVKRRPLPSDPTASAPPRPAPPEKTPSAPLPPHPAAVRPAHHEHTHSLPAMNGDHMRYSQRHAPEVPYDAYPSASQAPPPAKVYDTPDDFHREWSHAPAPPRRAPQEESYAYRERPDAYARPRSSYGNAPAPDYRSMPPSRPDYQSQPGPHPYESTSRPTSHHGNRPFPAPEQYGYEVDLRHGHEAAQYSPHSSTRSYNHSPVDYPQGSPGRPEPEHHYRVHSNSVASNRHHNFIAHENFHPEYAAMQPRVDDEEEEGPPPPPPAHRSGLVQPSQQLVPSPASSYKAYSPEFAPARRNTNDMTALPPLQPLQSHGNRPQDHPHMKNPSVPRSLVAGFDPAITEVEATRRRSVFEEAMPAALPYPDDTDPRRSLVRKSVSSDSRIVPRKSVSPRPPSMEERQVSQIPFSPDSYDALNPNAARSAVSRDTAPAYETIAQAMQTARLNEMKPDTSGPIIGDDGREIDPSDHLPSDTWAPEPERKNKKPEVILRFKHHSRDVAARPRSSGTPGAEYRTSPGTEYTERGREGYGHGHGRNYSTTERPRSSHRKSVSPAPSMRSTHSVSSLYAPVNVGPPIPAKVPIAPPAGPSYSVMGGHTGMDALSRELNSIDLGSVGCSVIRAPRKYVPKTITTGYAM
ncbi:hypothetical protein CNMCM6106_008199 [Aspergillus hiratsukae]|uniref:C2 domain-containing protein n=1 Tax=Aspergillus hiratsukae TaxID=1194566 RepID=A0A8H6QKY2_9EURO|nr:hypothetical protein CNMCM6106_008199 [Aspergillus hiratsukae]